MTVSAETTAKSFVLLPMGTRRIAFAADSVVELTSPQRLHNFPHRTPWISGVIVRRNRIVPVYDAGRLFGEQDALERRFYLIAEWQSGELRDLCAIPVSGECELVSCGPVTPIETEPDGRGSFAIGLIAVGDEEVEIVDLSRLIQTLRAHGESPQ